MDPTSWMVRAYRALLLLYPASTRERVGEDMAECFQDLCVETRRRRGLVGVLGVGLWTFLELPWSVARAHLATWKTGGGGGGFLETLWQDIRFAVRGLFQRPGFTALAVLSLGLGVGANTSMFNMMKATVWTELPVPHPDRLVRLFEVRDSHRDLSYPNFVDLTEQADVFSGAFLHRLENFGLLTEGSSERVTGEIVTADYFRVLGIEPELGRFLDPSIDGAPEAPLVAVVSHHLWSTTFGSDPGVVGRTIQLDKHPVTIVGVAPPRFHGTKFGIAMDLWVPMRTWAFQEGWYSTWSVARGNTSMLAVARLAPGVTRKEANAALTTIAARLGEQHPEVDRGMTFEALPEGAGSINPDMASLPDLIGLIALLASGLVLLVACGNVASLLLSRAVSRRREIGMRVALGAGRRRLVRQLLTESALLGTLGALFGVALSGWTSSLDRYLLPSIPYRLAIDTSPDARTLLFALGATVIAVLAFGLAPALHTSRGSVAEVLRSGDADGVGRAGGGRLLNAVVVGVVALSFVTLFLAGTFTQSLERVHAVRPGMEIRDRLIASLDLALGGHGDAEASTFYDRLLAEVRKVPGVEDAAVGSAIPLGDWSSSTRVFADDRAYGVDERGLRTWYASVSPGWFGAAGVRIVSGRGFTRRDAAAAPRVVVVNQAFVRAFWQGQSPLGKKVRLTREPGERTYRVVGVTETGRYWSVTEKPSPAMYFSMAQQPETQAVMVMRTDGSPGALAGPVRAAAHRVDPAVPLFDVKTMTAHMARAYWLYRVGAQLALVLGLLAAALAMGGLYGIMVFRVGRRRREMGIRIALGAGSARVMRHVLAASLRLVGIGVGLGVLVTLGASRLVEGLLYDVTPASGGRLVAVAAVLGLLATAASIMPAFSATRADPVRAIKAE